MLEPEDLEKTMLSPDGIKRAKGDYERTNRQIITPIEPAPKDIEEMSAGDNIKW